LTSPSLSFRLCAECGIFDIEKKKKANKKAELESWRIEKADYSWVVVVMSLFSGMLVVKHDVIEMYPR